MDSKEALPSRQKVFVLDTSVMIHDPYCLEKFQDNIVVLPFCVIEEIDGLKKAPNSVGENSRRSSRLIDKYKKQGSLKDGVPTKGGGLLIGDYTPRFKQIFPQGVEKKNDNIILATAKKWQNRKDRNKKEVYVVSKDINLRLKASVIGIKEQDYLNDKAAEQVDEIYSGFVSLKLPDSLCGELFSRLAREKKVDASFLGDRLKGKILFPNQCCKILNEETEKYVLAIYKTSGCSRHFHFIEKPKSATVGGSQREMVVKPINDEQAMAYALLCDPEILLTTIIGKAGSGKTLISLLAGVAMLDEGQRDRLKVYRPNIVMGKGLGFLPGDLAEKFDPWTLPITDNLSLIVNGKYSERSENGGGDMLEKKKGNLDRMEELLRAKIIEIVPTIYIRGRSLHRQYVIVDEAQNLTPHEVKTIITRIGVNSKIVLTGDLAQIDSPYLDATSNGLAHVVQRMRGQNVFGHITLQKSERSSLAELAANLL